MQCNWLAPSVLHHCSDKNEVVQAFYREDIMPIKFISLFTWGENTPGYTREQTCPDHKEHSTLDAGR